MTLASALSIALATTTLLLGAGGGLALVVPDALCRAMFQLQFDWTPLLTDEGRYLAYVLGLFLVALALLCGTAAALPKEVMLQRAVAITVTIWAVSTILFYCYLVSSASVPVWVPFAFSGLLLIILSAGLMVSVLSPPAPAPAAATALAAASAPTIGNLTLPKATLLVRSPRPFHRTPQRTSTGAIGTTTTETSRAALATAASTARAGGETPIDLAQPLLPAEDDNDDEDHELDQAVAVAVAGAVSVSSATPTAIARRSVVMTDDGETLEPAAGRPLPDVAVPLDTEETDEPATQLGFRRLLALAGPQQLLLVAGSLALLVRLPFSLAVPHVRTD
jgi:hypothetical protein